MKWKQRKPVIKINKSDDIISKLAKIRGITDLEQFLYPKKDSLHSPKLLNNVVEVAERVKEAILKNQKICLSSDCDTDGVTSTAMFYNYLSQFVEEENLHYVYNQRSNGHGIENQMNFIPKDTELLIILDSSTNSVEACKELSERNIDVIILDHHTVEKENPYAIIVNPQGDNYPNKSISGAGVAFKTMQVIDELFDVDTAFNFIDLCAVGMYGDMMDVSVLENRFIISEGMSNINNKGLLALLEIGNVKEVNSQTIGYKISPLINGCARLDRIELALELLTTDNELQCALIARDMNTLNEERKKKEKELVEKYTSNIDEKNKVIVAIDKTASKGFNGLVATKLASEYQRPSMVLREHKGQLSGSYRTYGDFDMQDFLRKCDVVEYADGHSFAGGVHISKDNLEEFLDYVNEALKDVEFEQVVEYDLEVNVRDVNKHLIKQVERFNYLVGQGVPKAVFKVNGLVVDERVVIGKNKDTIKIVCDDITALKFKVKDSYADELEDFDVIDVIGELTINEWTNWRTKVTTVTNQVLIQDYIKREG